MRNTHEYRPCIIVQREPSWGKPKQRLRITDKQAIAYQQTTAGSGSLIPWSHASFEVMQRAAFIAELVIKNQ